MKKFTWLNYKIGRAIIWLKWFDASLYLQKSSDDELRIIGKRILHMKPSTFPYDYIYRYYDMPVEVNRDEEGYPYVYDNGLELYGKKQWNDEEMRDYYVSLLLEQDIESPHCYITDDRRMPDIGDVLVDLGAAEGIFSLRMIDRVGKCYLFECDDEWIEPLKKTFSKWEKKVVLVNKFVGDKTDDRNNMITLDDYFIDNKIDYIKADIEGAEVDMILGARKTLSNCKRVLACSYHYQDDEKKIRRLLSDSEFDIFINEGYMMYYSFFRRFKRPYVRRGVIYGEKLQ